jgi:hypothetical protein
MAGRSMVPSWRNTSLSAWDENTDPFSEFRREMNRLLDNAFSSFGFPGVGSPAVGGMAAPKIDVSESENEIRVAAELGTSGSSTGSPTSSKSSKGSTYAMTGLPCNV